MKYKKELKNLFAILPNVNIFYVTWYLWQIIKYLLFCLSDWAISDTEKRTTQQIEKLKYNQLTFHLSLISTGLFWFVFGKENLFNVCTYVIGSYFYHATMILINL